MLAVFSHRALSIYKRLVIPRKLLQINVSINHTSSCLKGPALEKPNPRAAFCFSHKMIDHPCCVSPPPSAEVLASSSHAGLPNVATTNPAETAEAWLCRERNTSPSSEANPSHSQGSCHLGQGHTSAESQASRPSSSNRLVARGPVPTHGLGEEHILKGRGAQRTGESLLRSPIGRELQLSSSPVTAYIWPNGPRHLRWKTLKLNFLPTPGFPPGPCQFLP